MRNKFTSFLTVAVIIFNIFAVSAYAETAPTVTVGNASGKKGEVVEIAVAISGNTGFSSLGVEIGYDASALELTEVKGASGVGANFTTAPNYTVNPYNMGWDSASDVTYNGTLATLTFKILTDKDGEYPVTVDFYKGRDGNYTDGEDINYDADFEPLDLVYKSGKVTVKGQNEPVTSTGAVVTVESGNCKIGKTVTIPVTIAGNTGFSSLGIEIGYDKTALKLTNVTGSADVGANFTTAPNYTVNPYNMSWDSASNTTFNGTLATLTFEVITTQDGTYPVTVDYYKGRDGDYTDGEDVNYDEEFNPVKLKYVGGNITVKKANGNIPTVSVGEISSFNGISFDVTLEAESYNGKITAGLYSNDGVLKSSKVYPASETIPVSFEKGQTGSYVKIMWWNDLDSMIPVCDAQIISLQ